jgi:predicted Zn finger-like uncharacterized protein
MPQFGTRVSYALDKAFNRVLPIPKEPRQYKYRRPRRANSWVPSGRLGDPDYEERLKEFADYIRSLKISIVPSARGWAYILEGEGKVDKTQFQLVGKAIGDCIKAGFLSISMIAEDQDETRRFKEIEAAADALSVLKDLRHEVDGFESKLKQATTDYLAGEKYFLMMIVEKGDIRNLFEPICEEYHVPIASSKGWASNRNKFAVIRLAQKAHERGLTPVLLMFYDLDEVGLKISDTWEEKLDECARGAGGYGNLIFDRFGLNREDVEELGLTWITDPRNGEEKVESNALFRNNETLEAGKRLCRDAIEKYLGKDALKRFEEKEEKGIKLNKDQLEILENIRDELEEIEETLPKEPEQKEAKRRAKKREREKEVIVRPEPGYYPNCPSCHSSFNIDEEKDDGKLFKCRHCGQFMRLKLGKQQ